MNLKHVAYTTWIACEVEGDGYGKCKEACERMRQTFPELELRFGFFQASAPWGRRQHYWLRAPDGALLPSTDANYEDLAEASHDELCEKVPTGVCMDLRFELFQKIHNVIFPKKEGQ